MNQAYGTVFCVFLFAPIFVFFEIFRKHWTDASLRKAFWWSLPVGIGAVFLTRLAYVFVEYILGFDIRSFISGNYYWYFLLLANICVVGFIEEFIKAVGGLLVANIVDSERRSTIIFMSFVGCSLGFSLLENFQYYSAFGSSVVVSRVLISATAHLFFSALCAAITAKALSRNKSDYRISLRILLGIMLAAIMHGLFNFMVFYFEIAAMSGIVISILFLFVLGISEAWISVLKIDTQEIFCLISCFGCGSISFSKSKFCGFCGSRVTVLRKTRIISQNTTEEKFDKID